MLKKLKNNSGFTLVEMIVAAGLSSIIVFVAYTALKDSKGVVHTSVVAGEATFIKNQLIAHLGDPEVCNANFEGQDITRVNIPSLFRRQRVTGVPDTFTNVNFVALNQSYGESAVNTITVTNIRTALTLLQAAPPVYNNKSMTVTVDYNIRNSLKRSSGKTNSSVSIEVAIARDTTGLKVKSCFADVAGMIKSAIEYSCEGNGATFDTNAGTYGTCTHNRLEVLNEASAVVTPICPAGQFLYEVTSTKGTTGLPVTAASAGVTRYRCRTFSTITPSCASGEFMKGVNANGSPSCVAISTFLASIPNGSAISTIPGGYQKVTMNCATTDEVLRRIDSSGNPVCVHKVIVGSCPVDNYITGINTNGTPTCAKFPKNAATCPAGYYLKNVNSDGSIPAGGCAQLTINANCPGANDVMTAIDSAGNATCLTYLNPP